jgi:hypothetical protein
LFDGGQGGGTIRGEDAWFWLGKFLIEKFLSVIFVIDYLSYLLTTIIPTPQTKPGHTSILCLT